MELVFATGMAVTMSAVAVPQYLAAIDDFRAAGATRYISARLQRARMEAVVRSTEVAMQFTETKDGYRYAVYRDGNRNGVLMRDILDGIDRRIASVERLPDQFTGVDFGAIPGLPAVAFDWEPAASRAFPRPAPRLRAPSTSAVDAARNTPCASLAKPARRGC